MSRLPKLKIIRPSGNPDEELRELEQARYFLFSYGPGVEITVDGQVINSYEELVQLASQDRYKDREFIEVEVGLILTPGG